MSERNSTECIVYTFDDVTVDCANFRVEKNGYGVMLKPRDFDVLVYLIKNSGRVVEKQELFEQVWKDTFVSDNALTRVIKEIRHALGDPADHPHYIETVTKRGYRFIANGNAIGNALDAKYSTKPEEAKILEEVIVIPPQIETPHSVFSKVAAAMLDPFLNTVTGLVGLLRVNPQTVHTHRSPIKSLAVLPFSNESGNADVEYLSDGITEMLISSMSRIPQLNVKARSSVFRYKGKDAAVRTIGKDLNVRAILNGRVVQRAQDLTLHVELVDTLTENVLWKADYNRTMQNLVTLQSEIARDVSNRLQAKLSGADVRRLAKNQTEDPEAYQLYLRGRFHWNKRRALDFQRSIEYFQQAIDTDPNYALAFAGLADAYTLLSEYGGAQPRVVIPKARQAALKALALDDQMAEAHSALALALLNDYDFAGAEREYERALQLNPYDASTHQLYAVLLKYLGKHDESLVEAKLSLEIDPLSLANNRSYGDVLLYAGMYDEGLAQLEKTVDLDDNFAAVHASLFNAYRLYGNYDKAVEEYAKNQELIGEPQNAVIIRDSFARGGWEGFLRSMTREHRPANLASYHAATFHTALGEKDEAFAELNKAYEDREYFLVVLKVDPRLDPLRKDPRFRDLLLRVGFIA